MRRVQHQNKHASLPAFTTIPSNSYLKVRQLCKEKVINKTTPVKTASEIYEKSPEEILPLSHSDTQATFNRTGKHLSFQTM